MVPRKAVETRWDAVLGSTLIRSHYDNTSIDSKHQSLFAAVVLGGV
jgi:hypothetical protein